ncbi:calcium-transporting ATPase [Plakobranchus ocellatus]|uniref:Calcium-transporting ATPase n=1 Tax=Plakobranchus ocellatus TaxID=259542 RepID=A0AAV3ZG62_9GAST|nr:calcium-transporting ATPase [Plakobranchus ocellatus]
MKSTSSQQIRVINAFRMTLDTRYDNRSMSSLQSYHSVQNMRSGGAFGGYHHGKRPHMYQSASTEASDSTPLTGLSVSYTAPARVSETTAM